MSRMKPASSCSSYLRKLIIDRKGCLGRWVRQVHTWPAAGEGRVRATEKIHTEGLSYRGLRSHIRFGRLRKSGRVPWRQLGGNGLEGQIGFVAGSWEWWKIRLEQKKRWVWCLKTADWRVRESDQKPNPDHKIHPRERNMVVLDNGLWTAWVLISALAFPVLKSRQIT